MIGESLIDIVTDSAGRTTEVVGGSPAKDWWAHVLS